MTSSRFLFPLSDEPETTEEMHFLTADLHVEKQSNIPDVEPALFQHLNYFLAVPELQDRYHNMFAMCL